MVPLEIKNISSSIFNKQIIQVYNPNLNAITNLHFKIKNSNWNHQIDTIAPLSSIKISLPENYLSPKLNIKVDSDNNQMVDFSINNYRFYFGLIIIVSFVITLIGIGGIIFKRKHR
ncbi:hypothetical protein SDC9_151286 [bioreactor metagenome]|uniref:Alpha-galactosidase NEW3 domain-containing protein n=1 Tax=bioreactor metagenome TaxID=1076179 RepID=A0A645ERN7_9ZZZZ